MTWETPQVVELEMNAEIGGYQADDSREGEEPIATTSEPELSEAR